MEGYNAIIWLAGMVMLKPDFALGIEVRGLDQALEKCPYDDLTERQRATFEAAINDPLVKSIIRSAWLAYDAARERGDIPSATEADDPWMP